MAAQVEDEADGPCLGTSAVGAAQYTDSLTGVLSPMVAKCDDGIQQAVNSQAVLAQQIDRVASELQRFLSASHIPSFSPHAQRLQDIRKRVTSANGTLSHVQARLARIERQAAQMQREVGEQSQDPIT